jgi:hypothetical protein
VTILVACRSGSEIPLQRGYWISRNAPGVISRNIKHPVSRNISRDFLQDTLIARKHFIQHKGIPSAPKAIVRNKTPHNGGCQHAEKGSRRSHVLGAARQLMAFRPNAVHYRFNC